MKKIFRKIEQLIKDPLLRLFSYQRLKKNNYIVNFIHEGGSQIMLPKLSFWSALVGYGINTVRNFDYMDRPFAEVLLRKTIYELYQQGFISSKKSIIDIGSWISDNSLIWARNLTDEAVVIAIDPSPQNLEYGKHLASINKIENMRWVEAVCTENAGERLDFDGSIHHATFKPTSSDEHMLSSSLDTIINSENNRSIGLIHVDVEGFELQVLKGARDIILRDMPVISFEQHISSEDVNSVASYLKNFGYKIFMVNEVLPFCALDCRNFIAFDSTRALPVFKDFKQKNGRELSVFSATIGSRLIEI